MGIHSIGLKKLKKGSISNMNEIKKQRGLTPQKMSTSNVNYASTPAQEHANVKKIKIDLG